MSAPATLAAGLIGASLLATAAAQARSANQVVGTWRMVSAQVDPRGRKAPAYGAKPSGLLVFTSDMHYVEVLTDAGVPRFASDARGHGTPDENRAAMAGSIGMFGTYTVDADGAFSGDRVEGATFPNWVGDVRTREVLRITVDGDTMTERFRRPEGAEIVITYHRESRGAVP